MIQVSMTKLKHISVFHHPRYFLRRLVQYLWRQGYLCDIIINDTTIYRTILALTEHKLCKLQQNNTHLLWCYWTTLCLPVMIKRWSASILQKLKVSHVWYSKIFNLFSFIFPLRNMKWLFLTKCYSTFAHSKLRLFSCV